MDRLFLFPEPFPDESLYSLAVRYHRLVSNKSYRQTSQELFGTYSRTCGSVLPCCLGALSQRLEGQYSVRELIETRTLLPLYRPFLSEQVYESAILCMQGTNGTGLKMSLGMTASGLLKHASFRYCEACMHHDSNVFGMPYWHRIHMAAGVCICPTHGNVLLGMSFPEGADWRSMFLPGEFASEPVLRTPSLDAAFAVAKMQFWGLQNPQQACDLVDGEFLRWRLTEMGMVHRGRLRELAIRKFLEPRLDFSTKEVEYQSVTKGFEWIMCLLRRNRWTIQPFRYYFLSWLLGSSVSDLSAFQCRAFYYSPKAVSAVTHVYRPDKKMVVARRREFKRDISKKCHDKSGYYWLHRHDREWLNKYVKKNTFIRIRDSSIKWSVQDARLAKELLGARDKIFNIKGKPTKITKSALLRRVSLKYRFLRDFSMFTESSRILGELLETEHDFQIRKLHWAITNFSISGQSAASVIMRFAGIRIRLVSQSELDRLFLAR
ncbi:transposase [Pseudomonas sp. Seg1]|uniref:TnsD family Tn7-like transposition protein n=1 Tax=Pseudomonas sp. Seg1 TaxID=2678259 RepID=UPI001BB39D4B|nr:TnsD family Tn7-like transposition protein [Pseudomonas sp. Seg1]BBP73871.1 transposase [Pseudomonas sp. Seg1]